MLSFDYCHFEVCLGTDEDITLKEVNDLRKNCQRLADEAVRQYKIAKEKATLQYYRDIEKRELLKNIELIKQKPESEWTAEEKAKMKVIEDQKYWDEYRYYYEDDDEPKDLVLTPTSLAPIRVGDFNYDK